eukprot:1140946-Pelagomonas_calceolata.AAC.2
MHTLSSQEHSFIEKAPHVIQAWMLCTEGVQQGDAECLPAYPSYEELLKRCTYFASLATSAGKLDMRLDDRLSTRKVPAMGSNSCRGNCVVLVKLKSKRCRLLRPDRVPRGMLPAPGTPAQCSHESWFLASVCSPAQQRNS